MKNIQLIIPMSGLGLRFVNAGYTDPKPLIKVDNKPIIQHVLELFPGVDTVTFICNEMHLATTDMESVLRTIAPNSKIVSIPYQKLGPVNAILAAQEYINDDMETIVSYCDYGTVWDFEKFINDARKTNAEGSIACYKGFHPHMLGSDNYAFCREENNILLEIKEKQPFTSNKMNEYASNGTYYFSSGSILKKYFSKLIDSKIDTNGEYYVSMVYNLMVVDGLRVNIFEIEKMLQWGTPYDLEIYKQWSDYFFKINKYGHPKIEDSVSTLILPMAGHGSRFSEVGYKLPKPFLPVQNKPMFEQAIDCLPKTDKAVFISLEEHISKYDIHKVLKDKYDSYQVISVPNVTSGQASTCQIGIISAGVDSDTPITISACDNGVYYDSHKYKTLLDDPTIDVIVWSFRNNQASKVNPHMYSWLDVDVNNNIKYVSCKNFIYENPLQTHAIIGTMFFRKAKYFLDGLVENHKNKFTTNGEYYVDDVINRCIEAGLTVKVFEVENYICWGTPDDYKTYLYWEEHFKKGVI
jgi:NDP-sugar pyrophosphorylase family protein